LRGQWAEPVEVFGEALFSRGVTALDQLTHECQILIDADEVTATAKSQCLVDGILEVTMRRLDVTVLMRLADVDAMATYSVVGQQVVILRGELLVTREVVDRGGQTITAHATRNSAGEMQCVLQTCREGLERFGMAEVNVLPVRVGQDRMKHQVIEQLPAERDLQLVHDDEVERDQITRVMHLRKLDFLFDPMFQLPILDASFECATDRVGHARFADGWIVFLLEPIKNRVGLKF
jgi:hypothetical protein